MESLDLFLNPQRKPRKKFKLGPFGEAEFEMKILDADEGMAISKEVQRRDLKGIEIFYPSLVACLTAPDLHDAKLLDALSKREGREIMDAEEALKLMFTSNELSALITVYNDYSNVTIDFVEQVEEVKN